MLKMLNLLSDLLSEKALLVTVAVLIPFTDICAAIPECRLITLLLTTSPE